MFVSVDGSETMAAKLFKHLIIGAKKVSDQPVKDDPAATKTTGSAPGAVGTVQELRSASPAKANRASAFSSSSSSSSWLVGPDLGPAGTDGTRRHSDASTIRGRGATRIPGGRTRADPMSFRGGSTRLPPGARREGACEGGGGRGRGAMGAAKNPRTEGLSTEGEGGGTSTAFCQPPIATEYSDPFDLRQQSRTDTDAKSNIKAWSSEDDYSVPYEVLAENDAGHKPSELNNKKLPSLKPEPVLTAEVASLSETSPETAAAAATVPCALDDAENSIATIPESESEISAAEESEPDNARAAESERKPDANLDSAFDGSGLGATSAIDGSLQPPAVGSDPVLMDPSAGMYDDPWDLCALQKNLEEKLLKAKITPPPGDPDCGAAANFGSKEEAGDPSKDFAEQIYDEPWDKRAENLHQSFLMAGAGMDCEVQPCFAPDQIQKYKYVSTDPDCAPHHQCEHTPIGARTCRTVGEQLKARSSVRTGIGSRHPLHSSFCALHSDNSLNSQLHNNSRHSSLQRGCETPDDIFLLEKESWYHGDISRVAAESLLRCHQEGSYLVRLSESDRRDYSLSVKSNSGGFMHLKIVRHESGFVLGQFSQPFANIPHMILYYTINKLPIRGTEHITLSFPVCNELPL